MNGQTCRTRCGLLRNGPVVRGRVSAQHSQVCGDRLCPGGGLLFAEGRQERKDDVFEQMKVLRWHRSIAILTYHLDVVEKMVPWSNVDGLRCCCWAELNFAMSNYAKRVCVRASVVGFPLFLSQCPVTYIS